MTHLSEERNIPLPPAAIWRIITDTTRWPQFYAASNDTLHLRSVEYLHGAVADGPDVKRRLHFLGVPSWDEQVSAWREDELVAWLGVRNPGLKYWQQQMELIPARDYTTLRWDLFYSMKAPRAVKKPFAALMDSILIASLERIERLALDENKL